MKVVIWSKYLLLYNLFLPTRTNGFFDEIHVCLENAKRLQTKQNGIKNNDVKLLLAYIRKIQNTTEFRILASNKIALLTKAIVSKKKIDISIWKVSYTII